MNINDFVILPGSKSGTSVRLKTKTVRELQLEKVQLEKENKEMEKKLQQLQLNMSREKEERKKLSPYHWRSGQAGPMTTQARVLSQSKEGWKKVSSGKVKLQILKEHSEEPVKEQFKPEVENAVAHTKSEVKGTACGLSEFSSVLLDPASESACAGPGNEARGLLLNGTYKEEDSAKCFQEALLQWREGSSGPPEHLPAPEVPPESVGICEVQTSVTVLEEPVHVEFKRDGLSYMEKLLLKKYRRSPVDQISDSCMKDLKAVQTLSVHQAVTGGGEGNEDEDDDVDDLPVEGMKTFWASLFRVEEPNTISGSAEPEASLKIEFLGDSHSMDLEESSNYLVVESGAEGVSKQGKTEPLEQCGRNPVSSKEIPQEQVVCSPVERSGVPKESSKAEAEGGSLEPWEAPGQLSDPAELLDTKLLGTELQRPPKGSQELGRGCNNQSLALPVTKKPSALQAVARRHKSVSSRYRGLEGFFGPGANPTQGMLQARSSLAAASSPVDRSIPFPGDGQWVSERSLSEYADGSVVQGVLERQLTRPASGVKAQQALCPLMGLWSSGPEKHSSLTCEDGASSSSHLEICGNTPDFHENLEICGNAPDFHENLEISGNAPDCHENLEISGNAPDFHENLEISGNAPDFHENLELKDHDSVDIFGVWDESQMDEEEEILEDKQQVLALQ